MSRQVLVAGSASLLASHVAALRLSSSEDVVFLYVHGPEGLPLAPGETVALVRQAARRLVPEAEAEAHQARIDSRLRPLAEARALTSLPRVDEVWWLTDSHRAPEGVDAWAGHEVLRGLLARLGELGASEFNLVGPALAGDTDASAASHRAVEHEAEARCGASNVVLRVFRTAPVIADALPLEGAEREGLFPLLDALHGLKGEIEERLPGYFGAYPLRLWSPAGASLGLVHADQAAKCLLRIARSDGPLPRRIDITSLEQLPFAELCEHVARVQGLKLQVVEDRKALNAIDRDLHARLSGFHARLTPPRGPAAVPGNPFQDMLRLDTEALGALLQRIHQRQQEARAASRTRAASLFDTLAPRTVDRAGSPLPYRVAGSTGGSAIVLLNALGQGLHYWGRLMDLLARNHRVILWEPRGTEVGPHPFKLRDQVDDLEAILKNEGIEVCHLVGWCTGPKVAVEFYLRHPAAVASMVFLNGTFKCAGSPKELDTPYERNFEPLCGILDRRPAMAASILKSLRLSMGTDGSELAGEPDSEELSIRVLSLMNRDLRPHVLAPFRNETVVVNYARQLVDFWSHDTRKSAPQVRVPVLLLSAEHDAVASPEMSRMMAKLLPNARHVHVEGATHYCLYDRPELVAGLMEELFRASTGRAGTSASALPAFGHAFT